MDLTLVYPLIAALASALTTAFLMPILLKYCKRKGYYDMPNERTVHHSNNIPRLGGVLFIPSMLVGMVVALVVMISTSNTENTTLKLSTFIIMSGIFLMYIVGVVDDLYGLGARLKFIIQFVAALFLPFCGLYFNNLYGLFGLYEIPMWLGYPITVFVSLLIINSINLIDGIDGLSSSLCIIVLLAFTLIYRHFGVWGYSLFTLSLLGTVAVFLYYNLFGNVDRGTKTFMGDSGSLTLGYAMAFLTVKYAMNQPHLIPYRPEALLTSVTLVIVPTFDLVRVAISRLCNRRSIFSADKTHIHHKMLAVGLTMHASLAVIVGIQLLYCVLNYVLCVYAGLSFMAIFFLDVVSYMVLHIVLNHIIKRKAMVA